MNAINSECFKAGDTGHEIACNDALSGKVYELQLAVITIHHVK